MQGFIIVRWIKIFACLKYESVSLLFILY